MSLITLLAAAVPAVTLLAWAYYRSSVRVVRQRPPGPKPRPVIGNLLDIPLQRQWLAFDKWAKLYGDVVFVEVFGQRILVLGGTNATDDLFQRRSKIYSSRPRAVMINELMHTWDTQLSFMPYGEQWRDRRRAFHQHFNSSVVRQWDERQLTAARRLLQRLQAKPEQFNSHIRLTFGELIMDVTYGIDVSGEDDEYITDADEMLRLISEAVPGRFLVDVIPALKFVPSWFPGTGFKKHAAEARRLLERVADRPFRAVKEAMARGEARDCVLSRSLAAIPPDVDVHEKEIISRDMAAIAYAAGADTTVSSMLSFFLAMTIYPEVQKRAHAELDAVIGHDRLPEYADQGNLPYISAIVLELLRWQPVLPLGVPHATTTDDEYKGWFIPKGTIILGNAWSILHDPEVFPEPEEFRPERFLTANSSSYELDPNVRDPRTVAFGFGRRMCPGRHFAERSLFGVVASVLFAFTISPCIDEAGNPVIPQVVMSDALLSHPAPFDCVITSRSARAADLVRDIEDNSSAI